jgi:hypothetical protein
VGLLMTPKSQLRVKDFFCIHCGTVIDLDELTEVWIHRVTDEAPCPGQDHRKHVEHYAEPKLGTE